MCHAKAGTEHIPPSILLDQTPMRRRPGTRHIPARVQKLKAGKRLRLGAKRKTPPSSRTGLQVDPLRHLKSPASPTVSQLGSRDVGKFRRRLHSDLINVRFGPLCGLKSAISRGPRSASNGHRLAQSNTPPDHLWKIRNAVRGRPAIPRHEPPLGLLQFSVPESGTGTTAGLGNANDNAVKGGWEP